jgi:hypothetical protein
LGETIISIFLLVTAILMSGALMQASFQYQKMSKQRVEASAIAESTLDEIRAWANTMSAGRYNYNSDWSPYRGASRQDQGYRVLIDSRPDSVRLASPCNALEAVHGANGRFLDSSVVPVEVRVEWGSSDFVSLLTYIGEPARRTASVDVQQTGGSLAPNGFSEFSAQAVDANGDTIEDMMFRWYVQPVGATPGMGSLNPPWGGQLNPPTASGPRDGRSSSLKNSFRQVDGAWVVVGGDISVQAVTFGHGREVTGTTTARLQP